MSRALHRRLLPILAFMLLMNAVASPLMAHEGMGRAETASEQQSPTPCHEGEAGDTSPLSDHSGALPCCGDGMHCGCMPAGLVLALATPVPTAMHDSIPVFTKVSAPQTPPDSLLRPPIS